jgi:hypothetical protein
MTIGKEWMDNIIYIIYTPNMHIHFNQFICELIIVQLSHIA